MPEPIKPRRVHVDAEVRRVETVSPHLRRITLGGAGVAAFLDAEGADAPGAWVKLFVPSGEGRAYTIRRIDRRAGTLDLEFVLHERDGITGPASAWASRAQVGERIGFAGPRNGGFHLPSDAEWIVLAGDATALPAIQAIVDVLPDGIDITVCAETPSPEDRQPIGGPAQRRVTWLEQHDGPGEALYRALTRMPLPTTPGYVWIAGEAAAVRALRAHYLQTLALPRERVSTKGYWKVGEAAHRDGG